MTDVLLRSILGRPESMFAPDVEERRRELADSAGGSRILVIGGAGSIGSAFVKEAVGYHPDVLHVVDISENNLVELVRELRSSNACLPDDFRTLAIGLGSDEFRAFLRSERPYQYVVNFSALKHVRAERDPFTLMRMLTTNVLNVWDLLDYLPGSTTEKAFSVSSDKATNPVSLMGATKLLMERVHLCYAEKVPFSSTRFANVAFSDGSLLYGFMQRLAKWQPLAAPHDVRRYFISAEEAGQLCVLSCFLGGNREVFFPALPESDLLTFAEVAVQILESRGLRADVCRTEAEAREKALHIRPESRSWPCYFFASDTTGEKPFEEFFAKGDPVSFSRFRRIGVITHPRFDDRRQVEETLDTIRKLKRSGVWQKSELVGALRAAVPELAHEEKEKDLDQKM